MFKKISVIIASLLLLTGIFVFNRAPIIDNLDQIEVYLSSYSASTNIKKIKTEDFKFVLGVKGESYVMSVEDFCIDEFLDLVQAKVVLSEQFSDLVCYYGYSPKIKYLESINGKPINVHIAIRENCVKIGFPIIYGSF